MTSKQQHQQVAIGTTFLRIDDEDFLHGYDNGYQTFHVYRSKAEGIDTSTLLYLLRNGWNAGRTDQWTTGYITGWLAAFYEQETGQFALSTYVSALCDPESEEEKSA